MSQRNLDVTFSLNLKLRYFKLIPIIGRGYNDWVTGDINHSDVRTNNHPEINQNSSYTQTTMRTLAEENTD